MARPSCDAIRAADLTGRFRDPRVEPMRLLQVLKRPLQVGAAQREAEVVVRLVVVALQLEATAQRSHRCRIIV